MRHIARYASILAGAAALIAVAAQAQALDTLKMTIGQRGNWDTAVAELGTKKGIFAKHGLELEATYTRGSGETIQPVISGNVELGLAVGTLGAMSAFAKGAPIVIIGAQATGAADFWYAKDPAIKSLKDTAGKTIAFSTVGSSTNSIVLAFMHEFNLSAKPTATGSPPATLTQVMSGQIDVGWSSPPFAFKEIDAGQIHIIARGNDATIVRGQTVRTIIANADALKAKKEVLGRFVKAYLETIDYMYSSDPQVLADYAEFAKTTPEMAKRVRDEFFPRTLMQWGEIKGLDVLVKDAVTLKFTPHELTKDELAKLIQIVK